VKLLLQQFTFWQFGHVLGHFYAAFIQLQQLYLLAGFSGTFLAQRLREAIYGPLCLTPSQFVAGLAGSPPRLLTDSITLSKKTPTNRQNRQLIAKIIY